MKIANEVIALESDANKLLETRELAAKGDPNALNKYVLYSVLKQVRLRKELSPRKQLRAFREFVNTTALEVSLG